MYCEIVQRKVTNDNIIVIFSTTWAHNNFKLKIFVVLFRFYNENTQIDENRFLGYLR